MAGSPDPLGKRALFWAPAERVEENPQHPREPDVRGRHALFSAPEVPAAAAGAETATRKRSGTAARTKSSKSAGPATRAGSSRTRPSPTPRARSTSATRTGSTRRPRGDAPARPLDTVVTRSRQAASGLIGPISLECSGCNAKTDVDLFEYVLLHFPFWLWRPGRGYARLMTCPACRKRTWISASLGSRSL